MSTLYFCTFLHLYFVRTVHTKFYAKSGVSISKNERVMLNLVFSAVPLIHRSRLYLKASRQGHLLHRQISPVPNVSQILFTPQNVAIDQGINLRVVPTSQAGHPLVICASLHKCNDANGPLSNCGPYPLPALRAPIIIIIIVNYIPFGKNISEVKYHKIVELSLISFPTHYESVIQLSKNQ